MLQKGFGEVGVIDHMGNHSLLVEQALGCNGGFSSVQTWAEAQVGTTEVVP